MALPDCDLDLGRMELTVVWRGVPVTDGLRRRLYGMMTAFDWWLLEFKALRQAQVEGK